MAKNTHGGGANTNKNGLKFEQDTQLKSCLETYGYTVNDDNSVTDENHDIVGYNLPKGKIYEHFEHLRENGWQKYISKKLLPDDAFYNANNDTIYIIEKKWQSTNGSVDEKLQTCDFKKEEYEKMFLHNNIKVKYIYILNDFFKNPKYDDVRSYILRHGCSFFYYTLPLNEIGL